jgi:hypothetical protein
LIKRKCNRFSIPGATLCYRKKAFFLFKGKFSEDCFPVIDLSKGGAKFLCYERLRPGEFIRIKLRIPGKTPIYEIKGDIRWISRTFEQSYPYRIGISFRLFGPRKKNNPMEILRFLEELEREIKNKPV